MLGRVRPPLQKLGFEKEGSSWSQSLGKTRWFKGGVSVDGAAKCNFTNCSGGGSQACPAQGAAGTDRQTGKGPPFLPGGANDPLRRANGSTAARYFPRARASARIQGLPPMSIFWGRAAINRMRKGDLGGWPPRDISRALHGPTLCLVCLSQEAAHGRQSDAWVFFLGRQLQLLP